jgi:hypothetical protein
MIESDPRRKKNRQKRPETAISEVVVHVIPVPSFSDRRMVNDVSALGEVTSRELRHAVVQDDVDHSDFA